MCLSLFLQGRGPSRVWAPSHFNVIASSRPSLWGLQHRCFGRQVSPQHAGVPTALAVGPCKLCAAGSACEGPSPKSWTAVPEHDGDVLPVTPPHRLLCCCLSGTHGGPCPAAEVGDLPPHRVPPAQQRAGKSVPAREPGQGRGCFLRRHLWAPPGPTSH